MTERNWPKPVGRSLDVVPKGSPTPAERAAALEAEAAALAMQVARDLAASLVEAAALAAALSALNGISPELRQTAGNLFTDLQARSASLGRLIPTAD